MLGRQRLMDGAQGGAFIRGQVVVRAYERQCCLKTRFFVLIFE